MAFFARGPRAGLFAQVLDWMLMPLAILWLVAMVGSYLAATVIAENTFDLRLRDVLQATAEEVRVHEVDILAGRRLPVLNSLRDDPVDRFYVQLAHENGELMQGDAVVPPVGRREPRATPEVRFRDTYLELEDEVVTQGEGVRVAYRSVAMSSGNFYVVQVAEPLSRRLGLVHEVTLIAMLTVGLLVPGIVAMVWYGLRHGLEPLLRLSERVEARDPDDLSPIPLEKVPDEIAPLVATLNRQLERTRSSIEAQRRFVADAAHQMRTPLAGLKTQAEAAARESTLEEARARLARIEEGAERLGRLMAQLLALARADDALLRPGPREPTDLNGLLRDECATWADRALAKGVALGFDPAPRPPSSRECRCCCARCSPTCSTTPSATRPPAARSPRGVTVGARVEVVVEDNGRRHRARRSRAGVRPLLPRARHRRERQRARACRS